MTTPAMPPNPAATLYRQFFESQSTEELHVLARTKRFLEMWSSDDTLRARLEATDFADRAQLGAIAQEYGIEIDIALLQPVFSMALAHLRGTPGIADYPLAAAWDRYLTLMFRYRDLVRKEGDTRGTNPRFDTWRTRQMTRCAGELGLSSDSIVHPVITFELSDGCSVGCWFCGISADKFKGAWPYEPNQQLWREVLEHTVDFFGPAAATGFCYWATDPSDNPDYPRFIDDFFHATGVLPQTTTAAPLKDVELTRRTLALNATYRTTVNRFSVLNKKGVRKIHETFAPEELLGVELVTQNREAAVPKAVAGRARQRATERAAELSDEHTTIACVTGFLVKMPQGLVQLVTPCRSTDETPDGYFIMAERRFSDGPSFAKALRELQDSMAVELGMGDTLALRRDVKLERTGEGFTLRDKSWLHTVENGFAPRLAEILTAGTYTIQETYDTLLRDGADVFELAELLDWLFEKALLNEDPKHPGIRGLPNWQAAA